MSQDMFGNKGEKTLIALGSNQPTDARETRATVEAALGALAERFGELTVSGFYQTPCFPAGSGPDFVNVACCFYSGEAPAVILDVLHDIEAQFGRTREARWGARTLDIDLIAHGQNVSPSLAIYDYWRNLPLQEQMKEVPQELILPHPRLQDRSFVLVPLADIAPDWVHPVLGQSVLEMLAHRPAEERVGIARI